MAMDRAIEVGAAIRYKGKDGRFWVRNETMEGGREVSYEEQTVTRGHGQRNDGIAVMGGWVIQCTLIVCRHNMSSPTISKFPCYERLLDFDRA